MWTGKRIPDGPDTAAWNNTSVTCTEVAVPPKYIVCKPSDGMTCFDHLPRHLSTKQICPHGNYWLDVRL